MSKRNLLGGQIRAPNNNCAIPIYYTVINGQMLTDGIGWMQTNTFPPELCTSVLISDTSATEFVYVPPQPTPHHLLILCEHLRNAESTHGELGCDQQINFHLQ